MARNPFKPTAGATPPLLVGRQNQLDLFEESILDGPGSPGLLTMVTGARGTGKTVMLTELGDVARRQGWLVLDETATPGFLGRLGSAMDHASVELGSPPKRPVTSIGIGSLGSIGFAAAPETSESWRAKAVRLFESLQRHDDTGLVFTVDEIHGAKKEEVAQLAADVQHLIREGYPIALVCAGLPKSVEELLDHDTTTFLRRAERMPLGAVDLGEVKAALDRTFSESELPLSGAALDLATGETGGYPFMIQLVGYHVWRLAEGPVVSLDEAERGCEAARIRLGSLVHQTALNDLSGVDKTFLVAMAGDDGPSKIADIGKRLDRGGNFVGMYRDRLIKAGVIEPTSFGYVDFALPYLRQYLREHAVVVGATRDHA